MKKIVSVLAALAIAGGSAAYFPEAFSETDAYATSEYEIFTQGDIEYHVYSDHVLVYDCADDARSVTIPSSIDGIPVTEIWGFRNCDYLTSIELPDSITTIFYQAFNGCDSLKEIKLSNNLEEIGESAFGGCYSLSSITIPEKVNCIDTSTFEGCTALETVEFLGDIVKIQENAFYNCRKLKSIVIPESTTSIGKKAFYSCVKLASITILNENCDIYDAKWGEYDTEPIPSSTTIIGYRGSTAQEWAKANNRKFVPLDGAAIGDVNDDGSIDAVDASTVLSAYALIATGKDSGLSEAQLAAADVNSDDNVDAIDASLILRYYAYAATGGTETFDEYLNK